MVCLLDFMLITQTNPTCKECGQVFKKFKDSSLRWHQKCKSGLLDLLINMPDDSILLHHGNYEDLIDFIEDAEIDIVYKLNNESNFTHDDSSDEDDDYKDEEGEYEEYGYYKFDRILIQEACVLKDYFTEIDIFYAPYILKLFCI